MTMTVTFLKSALVNEYWQWASALMLGWYSVVHPNHARCARLQAKITCIIVDSELYGIVSMVVLASADALCAPVTPIMDWIPPQ